IGALIAGLTSMRRSGGDIRLPNLEKRIQGLFVMTRLLGPVFENYDTVEEAIERYSTNPPEPAGRSVESGAGPTPWGQNARRAGVPCVFLHPPGHLGLRLLPWRYITMRDPLRILVVDDEPDLELLIRQKFRKHIRSAEIEFSFAADGVEALELLQDGTDVDIVLSDINMPRMDGLSLLNGIQKLNKLLKVVMVSAYGDMGNIRTAMNRGAFDFITKPI